jgi:hypothetical protein
MVDLSGCVQIPGIDALVYGKITASTNLMSIMFPHSQVT